MNETGRGGTQGAVDAILRVYLDLSRRIVIAVSCAMFAFMVAINGLEIVGRGFFSISFSWVQEVSILGAMWVYFFAYALIAKNEEYIRVDFAVKLMPEAWQYAVDIFARLTTIFFQGMVAWFAVETYRFARALSHAIADIKASGSFTIIDIGCGSGAGGDNESAQFSVLSRELSSPVVS